MDSVVKMGADGSEYAPQLVKEVIRAAKSDESSILVIVLPGAEGL